MDDTHRENPAGACRPKALGCRTETGPQGPGSACLTPYAGIQAEVENGLQPFGRGTFAQSGGASIAADIP